jgi:peptidoglycan hydrolase-like protein with peptidoglycan-binding domain
MCDYDKVISTPVVTTAPVTVKSTPVVVSKDLKLGMTDPDIKKLQKLLNDKGFTIATSGVGSKGKENEYFGAKTKAALIKYQKANGISPANGYFGPVTKGKMGW